jgi:hypothetical protein
VKENRNTGKNPHQHLVPALQHDSLRKPLHLLKRSIFEVYTMYGKIGKFPTPFVT